MIDEFIKCKHSFLHFVKKYVKIYHPERGLVRFEPSELQKNLIRDYEEHNSVVVVKPRQRGFTTATLAWALWLAMFRHGQKILFVARTSRDAADLSNIVSNILNAMPPWLSGMAEKSSQDCKKFSLTESVIHFRCPTGIRGIDATHVVVEEAATIPDMNDCWNMICESTCHCGGGKIIVSSTPDGGEKWFSKFVSAAREGDNVFHLVDFNDRPDDAGSNKAEAFIERIKEQFHKKKVLQEESYFIPDKQTAEELIYLLASKEMSQEEFDRTHALVKRLKNID